jgi:hypothetical protein
MVKRGWFRWGFLGLLPVGLLLALLLAGRVRVDAAIQGAWSYSEPAIGGVSRQSAVHTEWTFDKGVFAAHSCCAFRPGFSGRYRVTEAEGDRLLLRLFDISGDAEGSLELRVIVDAGSDTLTIEGVGPFVRSVP